MNRWKLEMPVNCAEFRRWIDAYLADEVAASPRSLLDEHLGGCPDCVARLEVEGELVAALRTRLPRVPAPPGLETRIRAALDREAAPAGSTAWSWIRAPWFAGLAAASLLVVFLVGGRGGSETAFEQVRMLHVEHDVTVVDRECDRAGWPIAAQRKCTRASHLNALKLADGTYWSISPDTAAHREILVERSARGARFHVVGDYFPRIRTLQVHSAQRLVSDSL